MAKYITIRLKSGLSKTHSLDDEAATLTAEQACKTFYDDSNLANISTLRIETEIYFVREIELLSFS